MNLEFKVNLYNDKLNTLAILIILINDIIINLILYTWYLLYSYNIIKYPHPYFAYLVSLIHNIFVYMYILKRNISGSKLVLYSIFLFIFKLLPIISMTIKRDILIDYTCIYITAYIYLTYIVLIIIFNNILLKNNIDVLNIIKKNNVIYTADSVNNIINIKMS